MNKECDIFKLDSTCFNLINCECKFKRKSKLPLFPNELIKTQYKFVKMMYNNYIETLNDEDLKVHRPDIYSTYVRIDWNNYQLALKEYKDLII